MTEDELALAKRRVAACRPEVRPIRGPALAEPAELDWDDELGVVVLRGAGGALLGYCSLKAAEALAEGRDVDRER